MSGVARTERQARRTGPTDTGLNALTRQLIVEPIAVEVGERHRRLFSAAANMAELGTIDDLILAILTEPGLDTGLPPREVERQIRTGIEHTRRQRGEGGADECLILLFVSGADLFATWNKSIFDPTLPPTWKIGAAFDHVEIAPGRIVLIGGAPGAGKTALITQWTFDGLDLNPKLRAVVANVEMSPSRLLDRQLARLSGVPLTTIRRRQVVPDDVEKIDKAMTQISQVVPRLGVRQGTLYPRPDRRRRRRSRPT